MDTISNPSVLALFLEAGFVVKIVMLVLLTMSIASWTIIFNKIMHFKMINIRFAKFVKQINNRDFNLNELYQKALNSHDIPSKLLVKAVEEIKDSQSSPDYNLRREVERSLIAKLSSELMHVEKYLGFLATVGSSAVFIGLFGTVWGIMDSFQSIGFAKNTSLAVVAPGIAEALLATAMGLIAAIPAKIFYNKFSSDINKIAIDSGEVLIPCINKRVTSNSN